MFIKNIVISGFRSYKDQSFPEGLSPKHNVFIGKNGSGKSNFFAAVQFVLSEKFVTLRATERKDLFHCGAGRPALSAFVEIVFDNSDGRLVIPGHPEEEEVRIRRTLGFKQDEYRINDRRFTGAEVRQLLESAGFSSTNPYYIVEQGKIAGLVNMEEKQRYELLKDVAGTRVYEARRRESEGVLQETQARHVKIDESIGQLDSRLKELEAESCELKSYQSADAKRKGLEYAIYNLEQQTAKEELDRLDTEWQSRFHQVDMRRDDETKQQRSIKESEQQLQQITETELVLEQRRQSLEKERSRLHSRKTVLELQSTEVASVNTHHQKEKASLVKEASELQSTIDSSNQNLVQKRKALEEANTNASNDDAQTTKRSRLDTLQARRGRQGQMRSKAERDSWIKGEIAKNVEAIHSAESEMQRMDEEAHKLEATKKSNTKLATSLRSKIEEERSSAAATKKERADSLKARDALNAEKRKLWKELQDHDLSLRRLTTALEKSQSHYEKVVRFDIRQGLQSLQETLDEIGDSRLRHAVHGQVIDLFSVEPQFFTAVDIVAANALFNVVVTSFEDSAKILDHMNKKKKPGRITFFPLDTCKGVPANVAQSDDQTLLLSHIKYDAKYHGIFAEIFGKTLLVRSLAIGATVAKESGCDAVTLEGDQFSRKGSITGGFIDTKNNRLAAYSELAKAKLAHAEGKSICDRMCQSVASVEQKITEQLQAMERTNSQTSAFNSAQENDLHEAQMLEERAYRAQREIEQMQKTQMQLRLSIKTAQTLISSLEKEMESEFKSTLTKEEERELESLQNELELRRVASDAARAGASKLEAEIQLLEDTIRHLQSRHQNVKDRLQILTVSSGETQVYDRELTSLNDELAAVDAQFTQIDKELETAATQRRQLEEQVETMRRQLVTTARSAQEEKDLVDKMLNQRTLLTQRKDDAQSKMRKLGVVPSVADQFQAFSLGKLMHTLKQVNEELKKYGHVNKKALEQYTSLVDTRNELHESRQLLEKELESIHKLMEHLDQKKDEAIERTYKQVQFQFEEVFKELVAAEGSSAELQLVKSSRNGDENGDPFEAVRIKVSFGLGAPATDLSQLSGGQKSLVALSLIFAIQRCDPAPFYLFDEIDAALDAEYRTSVAKLLQRQSASCQFVTATFKTEMLEVADKVFGIFFHNKVSRIQEISPSEALSLLKQAALDERKRGREEPEEA